MRIAFISVWSHTVIEHKSRKETILLLISFTWLRSGFGFIYLLMYLFLHFDIGTAVHWHEEGFMHFMVVLCSCLTDGQFGRCRGTYLRLLSTPAPQDAAFVGETLRNPCIRARELKAATNLSHQKWIDTEGLEQVSLIARHATVKRPAYRRT